MHTLITDHGALATQDISHAVANTRAIQKAIDTVAASGGGVVTVPPGVFVTGMIYLKDRVRLHLDAGAVLRASPRPEDHPRRDLNVDMEWNGGLTGKDRFHLLAAIGCRDIAITGQGTLDGNGPAFYAPAAHELAWPRGHEDARRMCWTVHIENCQDVRLENVTITNVSFWTLHLHESDRVVVHGVRIINPPGAPNGDGIDITGCRDVMVSNCHIDTCDDGICLKTFPRGRSCEAITVTNCVIRTHCVALKLGCNESFKDIRNVTFSNCVVKNTHRAIGLYSWHGATFENIAFSNIVADTCLPLMYTRPIHIEAGSREPGANAGAIRNVMISNFIATTTGRILLAALPGATLEDVILRDIVLRYVAVDDPAPRAADVGGSQFVRGNTWARTARAALVADAVKNLTIDNFQVRWPTSPAPDAWRFNKKAANGSNDLYDPADWGEGTTPPFAAIMARNLRGGFLRHSSLTPFAAAPSAVITEDCQGFHTE